MGVSVFKQISTSLKLIEVKESYKDFFVWKGLLWAKKTTKKIVSKLVMDLQ